ncbi:hypothetical protein SteCoe_17005 [Stentor coeruleus]|uniref:TFIIE beta domain-containing protein n=1 Tax=Stentor coeruleus TaxID=5963 RepID=A0A1R2BZV6_9CILI|nr:hypothetical protein SteCoe_17005 [Stentor coeruleus]
MQPTDKKKRRNPHVNNIISKVIDCLRTANHPLTLNEIERSISVTLSHKEELLTIIKDNRKINYDEVQDRFSLNRLYEIYNKETLIEELKRLPRGIPQNQDLFDCYKGVEKDIASLREEGFIRQIYNSEKDKKFTVLFYRNPDDTAEKLSTTVSDFVKNMWKNLPSTETRERQKLIEEQRTTY